MAEQQGPSMVNQGTALRELLVTKPWIYGPGVYDCISAGAAAATGHDVAYMSGYSVAASLGFADLGVVTATQMVDRAREITSFYKRYPVVRNLPLIADADTGYGDFFNAIIATQDYIDAGVAAIHLEDQLSPKRCGQIAGKVCVSIDEATSKIEAASEARYERNPDLVIISRTDIIGAVGGDLDQAVERSIAYLKAGADLAWIEFPDTNLDQISYVPNKIKAYFRDHPGELPRHLKETGPRFAFNYSSNKEWHTADPLITHEMLAELCYRYIFTTMVGIHAAAKSMHDTFADYRKHGAEAQWRQEKDKKGHPTQSYQQMHGMAPLKFELAKRFDPESGKRLAESSGFGSTREGDHAARVHGRPGGKPGHETWAERDN